jgi:4'-phosphopantetheinyl transferase
VTAQIALHRADLDAPEFQDTSAFTEDERARAARYLEGRVRSRFIAGRCFLRRALALALGGTPQGLRFSVGPHGKPEVAGLHFNLSHSEGRALLATCSSHPVGVDLEALRELEVLQLARGQFDPAELAALTALDPADRRLGFFRVWTRKEALLKATGLGISTTLDRLVVSAGEAPEVLALRPPIPGQPGDWSLRELQPFPGFLGALACRASSLAVRWADES